MDASTFYLGFSTASWLHTQSTAPLLVTLHRIEQYLGNENWARPAVPWVMDSGGFNHIRTNGRWATSAQDFCEAVWSHSLHMPGMRWAAPQDWMCEPDVLKITGLTVAQHQARTVRNYVELTRIWQELEYAEGGSAWLLDPYNVTEETANAWRPSPFIPVLQGWDIDDYRRCVEDYYAVGVDLAALPLVGLGSVCRRQATTEIAKVVEVLAGEYGLKLHGFGVKVNGLRAYGQLLASADSHAWSYGARRTTEECPHGLVKWERNCPQYAVEWWERVVGELPCPN